jgi:pyridoxamine 5'-phosphate oxidase
MSELATSAELVARFQQWLADATKSEINDPTAMSLATVDAHGMPSVRMVLLKHADDAGFVFYTNLGSQKAQELLANPQAALCFHWKNLQRQVRVQGRALAVSDAEADAYFASRARDSRIGAWASKQSQPMQGRFELEKRVAEKALRFNIGDIPRPEFWSGFRIVPSVIEFWEAKPFRLHDRKRYALQADGNWQGAALFP